MDNPFLRSIFVRPPIVLEQKMKPFSAYHIAALMLLDSPYCPTNPQPTVTRQDLAIAAFVCAHGFEDGPDLLFPELHQDEFIKFCDPDANFEIENGAFQSYVNDYVTVPELWMPASTGENKSSGIPIPFHVVGVVLQAFQGFTEVQAWDMPIGRLIGYKCSVAEENGYNVKSQRDYEQIAIKQQIEAAARAENDG